MKIFLSSTFLDLVKERQVVLDALRRKRASIIAMEDFLATPTTPAETALENLRDSDVMVLVIGFKAGSLLSDGSDRSYTWAEYEELLRIGKDALVFVKQERGWFRRKPSWKNEERDPRKKKALNEFIARVGERYKWDYFETADQLALSVIQSLERWEAKGRPGARKTFASIEDYFSGKNPAGPFQLLDFGTTLLGRNQDFSALEEFFYDSSKRVALVSGRGGIGKSKLLHDWTRHHQAESLFLKDQPLWHEDSEKEIPVDCKVLIVDDAHRLDSLGNVLQLLRDTAKHRSLKLILSTRPGSTTRLAQSLYHHLDSALIVQLPELKELSGDESQALAKQVLGQDFQMYAAHLAEIGSNSPLVIVAGGRLIAARRINPASLTTLNEFRSAIFDRLLNQMDLNGPRFAINPPRPVLDLMAILGPINVELPAFQEAAQKLLGHPIDEVLSTVDALTTTGILTPRSKPVRVIPDVLSDWLVEDRCIGPSGRSTRYADRVYEALGAHSLKSLMRNLAELDWRKGQAGESGLNLLDGIWTDINDRFRQSDEYGRNGILGELSPAAIYQPVQVLGLIRTAINMPVILSDTSEGSQYRAGQSYVVSALPALLEGTAFHPEHIRESVGLLWRLAKGDPKHNSNGNSAKEVLKRLASWQRYTDASFNFGMLLQAIRLIALPEAFTDDYTPFEIIRQLLERDGEFTEWRDEATIAFGGFGLNYAAVGPIRRNTLDFLEFALAKDGIQAIQAITIMEYLLHNHLNRVGRASSPEEAAWQDAEREQCLNALMHRYDEPASAVLQARVYDALRSVTAISCPEWVRQQASIFTQALTVADSVAVIDSLCTADHELPTLSATFSEHDWERSITDVMSKGRTSLERLFDDPGDQVRFVLEQTKACLAVHVVTGGFYRFMGSFVDRPDFLEAMADAIVSEGSATLLEGKLPSVLNAIHISHAESFRLRAATAIKLNDVAVIHAASQNLRVFVNATEEDVALIRSYAEYPDPIAKAGAIFAITYMGKFTNLLLSLKAALLSVKTEGDGRVAAKLAEAFGSYGLPLTTLTREEAVALMTQFTLVQDWESNQGSIPRFLNRFVELFPDETFAMLVKRIKQSDTARAQYRVSFRTTGLIYGDVSFGSVPLKKRIELAAEALKCALQAGVEQGYTDLFWDIAGNDDSAFHLILKESRGMQEVTISKLTALLDKAIPSLAFAKLQFVKELLRNFQGEGRERIVEAITYQSYRHRDVAKDPQSSQESVVGGLSQEAEFDDLLKSVRRLI